MNYTTPGVWSLIWILFVTLRNYAMLTMRCFQPSVLSVPKLHSILNYGMHYKPFSKSEEASTLNSIDHRLLDETLRDFKEAGADLPQDQRSRLEEISQELAQVTQNFRNRYWMRPMSGTRGQRRG